MYQNNIQLTFIIACYNAEKYIKRTIQSIFKNKFLTEESVEVICINDGSSDGTFESLNQLLLKYPIKIFDQSNKGVGITKNRGLEEAKGQYVMILDADDWIDAKVISESLDYALENDIDLMAFGMQYVDENNKYMHIKDIYPGPKETVSTGSEVLLNGYQPSSVCLFLMNNKFFKDYNMRFYNGTQLDVELSTRLMLNAQKVYFSEKIGYYYFRNQGSITKATSDKNIKRYLYDSVKIAILGKENIGKIKDKALKRVIIQNNNSILWNLLWRFLSKPKEVDYAFKLECLNALKEKNLYPIKGSLKTSFQKVTRLIFNQEWLFKKFLKR
ncbi:MAG: glycosyltransferase [Bacteroidetes bacterium]|jgi:glycosyltransferase involved in cell wall biosynthesis|nr:glycosyltransferase [Bacteroidota bacterium]